MMSNVFRLQITGELCGMFRKMLEIHSSWHGLKSPPF